MPSKVSAMQGGFPRAKQGRDQWDVVIVPFPFSTHPGNKRRPALVLSSRAFNNHGASVLSMITTAGHHPWPGDVHLTELKPAGLSAPSHGATQTVHP